MLRLKLNLSFLVGLVITASIVLSGCSNSGSGKTEESAMLNIEKSSLQRVSPKESLEAISTLSDLNNDFAVNFYKRLSGMTGNIVFSPYSISLAMAMAYAGANGETEKPQSEWRD